MTLFVIAGTLLIGAYYVVDATYVQPAQQDVFSEKLTAFQPGLSFVKMMQMEEPQRAALIHSMPSDTKFLVMQEAKKHPSFVTETVGDIKAQSGSDVRLLKLTQVAALKGYDASGTAALMESGPKSFLRFDGFGVTPGFDQRVYLTKDGSVSTGVDLGLLKATTGSQNYDITGIDTETYNIVIIYSKTFDEYYAHARFLKS